MGEETTPGPRYELPDWEALERQYKESGSPVRLSRPLEPTPDTVQPHFTNTKPLARWVVAMLTIGMVARGGALATSWVLRSWFNGEAKPADDFIETIAGLSTLSGFVIIATSVVTAVLWVIWLSYSYSNLPGLGRQPRYRKFWTWLGWVVPIWNLFRPKEIHNEVWRSGGTEAIPFWHHCWWALYLASLIALNVVSATEYTWADVIAFAVGILAAIPAIAVVWASAVRQWNQRYETDTQAARSLGPFAKYAPTGTAVATFGMAALLILMPHSEELPEGAQVTALLDIAPGECFTGSESEDLGLVWVVECSGPHTGESVGVVEVDAVSYPGLNALSDFATIGCWAAYYEYAGDTADNLDYTLEWFSPLGAGWIERYDSVVCMVSHVEDKTLSTSVADPDSPWIPLERIRPHRCYEFHETLLAATELPCSAGGLKVGKVERYGNDPLLEFPGEQNIREDLACPTGAAVDPIVPTSESWVLGDRVSLCLAPEAGSA